MKEFSKEREKFLNKRKELEEKKRKLTKNIDKERRELDNMCGHNVMFLIHYEKVKKTKYFVRSYCYLCGRTILIKKLNDENYNNLIDVYPIVTKFIPSYVSDSFKICIVNEAVDSIVRNFNPASYTELASLCKEINNKLLSSINNINSFSDLQNEFINISEEKRKALSKQL